MSCIDSAMSWQEAADYAETLVLGGYDDWRLPTAKELFSLSDFSQGWPYLDTEYFDLVGATGVAPPEGTDGAPTDVPPPADGAPPPDETGDGTVSKDEQYWASYYVGTTHGGQASAFGVNAATGHIKAYPAEVSGQFGNYVRVVRGDVYGENNFVDNGDGTVTDLATGLMWQQADSGVGMDWEDALDYAEDLELAGYDDWFLPDIKQLQSIIDYTQSPSAVNVEDVGPAIDTDYFQITGLPDGTTNTDGDYPYFWSSTSAYFGVDNPEYYYAWYVAFGTAVDDAGDDSHGAGGVRYDTKVEGGPDGEGGERIYNFVRAVRYVGDDIATNDVPTAEAGEPYSGQVGDTITLDASGSIDTDGTITLYEWDLDNDGLYDDATGVTADFSTPTAGTYTVGLRVTDDDGAIDTDVATVTVIALSYVAPIADAGGPYSGAVGDAITLSGAASTDPDGSIMAYAWDLDVDGLFDDATGVTATFGAAAPGILAVSLRVTDDDGATDIDTTTITVADVPNLAPTADAGGPYAATVGEIITISAAASTDADGEIVAYAWDLDNDGRHNDATAMTVTFDATTAGTFTVGLRVTDDDWAADDAVATINVSANDTPSLSPVDDVTLSGLDLTTSDIEYLVEPAHDGYLTLLSAADELQWRLFDPGTMDEITPMIADEEGRVDYQVAGDETYLLRLTGQATDFDLRLVNLVNESNENVNVYGTDGEDSFAIQCTSCQITINGVAYDFDESVVSSVQFDGADGADRVHVTGTAHSERIDLSPGSGSLSGDAIEVAFVNTENTHVDGGGGVDGAFLVDSDGDDTVVANALGMIMTGETLDGVAHSNSVSNVAYAHAYAKTGGTDRAELNGTAGKYDCFKGYVDPADPNGQYGKLWTNSVLLRAKFFEEIVAQGNEGDSDKAVFVSTADADQFEAGPDAATLTNSHVQYVANDFADMRAYALGNHATLVLAESEGNDKMWLLSHKAVATGTDYRVLARSFDHVIADATIYDGDRDEVRLYDSPEDDTLTVTLDEARLTGGVDFTARGFRKVKTYSLYSGDTDVATIAGGPGDDSLTAHSNSNGVLSTEDYIDLLASTPEGIALLRAVAFSDVTVDSGDGDDTADTPDDLSALDYVLRMEGQWDE